MKKLFYMALLAVLLLAAGCSNNDTEYYIRYEGHYYEWTAGPDKMVTYTVSTPDGSKSFRLGTDFEYVCGPVEKGFLAEIEIGGEDWNRCATYIYEARGENGAFVRRTHGGAYAKLTVGGY